MSEVRLKLNTFFLSHCRESGEMGALHSGRRVGAVLLRRRQNDREAGRAGRRLLHNRRRPGRGASAAQLAGDHLDVLFRHIGRRIVRSRHLGCHRRRRHRNARRSRTLGAIRLLRYRFFFKFETFLFSMEHAKTSVFCYWSDTH